MQHCRSPLNRLATHPVLQVEPPRRRIVHGDPAEGEHHLAEEVVAAEHVAVPHGQPHGAVLDLVQRQLELEEKTVWFNNA